MSPSVAFFYRILLKVCHFLRSRSVSIRSTARDTLVKILLSLGTRFFPYILTELRGTLNRGYQRHVLCSTVHLLLKRIEGKIQPGDVDVCLTSLQEVCGQTFLTYQPQFPSLTVWGKNVHGTWAKIALTIKIKKKKKCMLSILDLPVCHGET